VVALNEATLTEVSAALGAREISATDLVETCLGRIAETAELNSFLWVDETGARKAAAECDERLRAGEARSPLEGVPIAVKDNILAEGQPGGAGSAILDGYVAPYDSTVVRQLRASGAIVLGRTNLDEFAMGSSNEHSRAGPAKNPWDTARVSGGSSGGSAVAVAARQVFGSFGTDTGGSIRQPASLCGIYGLKPTYGRVSRRGIIAFASSLDQVGPFARSASDLAVLLSSIAGFDDGDSTSVEHDVPDYRAAVDAGIEGLRIGVPAEYFGDGLDPEVEAGVRAAIAKLEALGATVQPVSLPHTKYALSTYYLIAPAEAASNLARFDGVRYGRRVAANDLREMITRSRHEGFGAEVKQRIILGTYVLSAGYYDAYYGKAQKVRTLIRRDFERVFEDVDVLATPTSPTTAFPIGARTDDPLSMYLADVLTLAVNLAGVPGLSLPAGLSSEGLPIGLQLIGRWFGEDQLLAAAGAFEQATEHAAARPPA